MIDEGSDIILLSEHWLWPFDLHKLQVIHPDYAGFGYSDKRLDEESILIRGCGGVGFLWRKSLPITPLTSVSSGRFCVIQLQPENLAKAAYIIGVYLPSCHHPMENSLSDQCPPANW